MVEWVNMKKIARNLVKESVFCLILLPGVHLWASNSAWEERPKGPVFFRLSSVFGVGCLEVGVCWHTATKSVSDDFLSPAPGCTVPLPPSYGPWYLADSMLIQLANATEKKSVFMIYFLD